MTKLPYVVECKSTYPFWEAIAAFNVDSVAKRYAADCAAGAKAQDLPYEYRVKYRGKVLEAA